MSTTMQSWPGGVAAAVIFAFKISVQTSVLVLWTDGQTDKNRQTTAVTLRLRFAARVNNNAVQV